MLGNTASVYGSFLWPSSAAPRYLTGGATLVGVCVACCAGALTICASLARANSALERRAREEGANDEGGFRYIL
jgi:hypothetical protein